MSDDFSLVADYSFNSSKLTAQWDEIITDGGGANSPTSDWDNQGFVSMKVPDPNDRIVRQSKEYFRIRGHHLLRSQITTILNVNTITSEAGATVTSRIGMFDKHSDKTVDSGQAGFFFEYTVNDTDDTNNPLSIGIRSDPDGDSNADIIIPQANFNVNDLSRSSHVGILEWSKLYTFEILYNAIGYIEWAIYLDGERILLHKYQNIDAVLPALPKFITPIRCEITNNYTTAEGSTDEMKQFNTSVSTTNNTTTLLNSSYKFKHLTDVSNLLYTINSTSYQPIFSFRLKTAYARETIKLYKILYLIQRARPFSYAIVRNGVPGTAVWVDAGVDCKLEYDISSNSMGNTTEIIYEQFIDTDQFMDMESGISKVTISPGVLSADINGVSDVFTVIVRKQSSKNAIVNFGLRWVEEC